jgi:hypothetical protein
LLRISGTTRSWLAFASPDAFAATFVPSMATTPTVTSPASPHSDRTEVNSSAGASWRLRNFEIGESSGTRITR